MITKTFFGKTPNGKDVFLYTLSNQNGVIVEILNYGGIIKSVQTPDRNGKTDEISLGFDHLKAYLKNPPYFGAVIGRHAGRIKGASFSLNGRTCHLEKNDGNNHLHGGRAGFDKKVWQDEVKDDTLSLSYFSPDGEEFYPGNLQVRVVYSLDGDNRLSIAYSAKTDADTILNLTNHAYFNLSGKGDILDHSISIDADRFIPIDKEYLPTGKILPVNKTPLDLRERIKIGERIFSPHEQLAYANGFDHDYIINAPDIKKSCCTLLCEKTGRMLEVFTTSPVVHLYTGNFLDGSAAPVRGGLCLETQGYSDAVNNAAFASSVLRAGETYQSCTVYKFTALSDC